MPRFPLRVATVLVAAAAPVALPALQPAPLVPCRVSLDSLDARVRRNYAGYVLEVAPHRAAEYEATVRRARHAAAVAGRATEPCTRALRAYVDWFDDPHLFLYQQPAADTAANRVREAARAHDPRDEAALRVEFARRPDGLDPLEGIWRDGPLRVGVVRQHAASDTFVAIVLAADTTAWPVGAIRARFVRQPDGRYDGELLTREFGARVVRATVHRRVLLRLSPGMWGREFPLHPADSALRPDPDPRRPRLVFRAASAVFAIPSHDGPYQRVIDSLVATHRDRLRQSPLLVLDLRGNEGGSSLTTRALHPLLVSRDARDSTPDQARPLMLSSPEQVAYARRVGGDRPSLRQQQLIARLEANPGALVPTSEQPTPVLPFAVPLEGDWRVAVLTDRGTVSAAEVTVRLALRSTRALVIGEPTAGALDYQSTQIIGLGTGDRRWGLGYPTVAAHGALPVGGVRGVGIAPDVPLRWADVDDAYAAAERIMGVVPATDPGVHRDVPARASGSAVDRTLR